MANTFIRVQAYGGEAAQAVIGEMCREPEFSTHVEKPQPTDHELAKQLRQAVADYMATPERYTDDKGRSIERKRRKDAKCLIAGVASHPTPLGQLRRAEGEAWLQDVKAHIRREYRGQRIAFKTHVDEGFLHLHFVIVGDANKLHPGLKAEREGGKRKAGKRSGDYRAGVQAFVDRYHDAVAAPRGWARKGPKPTWRIKDRALRQKAAELEREIKLLQEQVKAKPELKPRLEQLSGAFGSILSTAKQQHWPRPSTNAGLRLKPPSF